MNNGSVHQSPSLTTVVRIRDLVLAQTNELLTTIKMVDCHMNYNTRSVLTVLEVFQYGMSTGNGEALTLWMVSWTYFQ